MLRYKSEGIPPCYLGKHLVVIFFIPFSMQMPAPSGNLSSGFRDKSAWSLGTLLTFTRSEPGTNHSQYGPNHRNVCSEVFAAAGKPVMIVRSFRMV